MESSSDKTIMYDPDQYIMELKPKVVETQGMYLFLINIAFMLRNYAMNAHRKMGYFICDGVQSIIRAQ